MTNLVLVVGLLAMLNISVHWLSAITRANTARRAATRSLIERSLAIDPGLTVTILIPAWNEVSTIPQCIASLRNQTRGDWTAICIAGGSDGTLTLARQLVKGDDRFRVIEQGPLGKNAALSRVLPLVKSDIVVVLDADSVVAPDWLEMLLLGLHNGADAVCGDYRPLRSSWISETEQMEKLASVAIWGDVTLQGSGSIAVRRRTLIGVGGFPPEVSAGVDWDLDARLDRAGARVEFADGAMLMTERPTTLREFWRNEFRWRQAHLKSLFRLSDLFLRDPWLVIRNLGTYVLPWLFLAMGVLAAIASIHDHTNLERTMVSLLLLGIGWIIGIRASFLVGVYAYTRLPSALRLLMANPILSCLTLLASMGATLMWFRPLPQVRGPRTMSA